MGFLFFTVHRICIICRFRVQNHGYQMISVLNGYSQTIPHDIPDDIDGNYPWQNGTIAHSLYHLSYPREACIIYHFYVNQLLNQLTINSRMELFPNHLIMMMIQPWWWIIINDDDIVMIIIHFTRFFCKPSILGYPIYGNPHLSMVKLLRLEQPQGCRAPRLWQRSHEAEIDLGFEATVVDSTTALFVHGRMQVYLWCIV